MQNRRMVVCGDCDDDGEADGDGDFRNRFVKGRCSVVHLRL